VNLTDLQNKRVLVLGAGKSGVASCRFLVGKAKEVFLSESKIVSEILKEEIGRLQEKGLKFEEGNNSEEFLDSADLVIISPGISPSSEIVKKLSAKNIPIISEVELASYFIKTPIIAVTGTNGKTTTTTLIAHLINSTDTKKAIACGNIGLPMIEVLNRNLNVDYCVLEISSYQMFYSPTLSPYIAVFLNLTPDHLEWHEGLENYMAAKKKLFHQQKFNSYSILNYLDPVVKDIKTAGKLIYFSSFLKSRSDLEGFENFSFFDGESLNIKYENKISRIIDKSDLKILGLHNIENALASISVLKILGIKDILLSSGLKSFMGVEHRIEFVDEIKGIKFYNDSKATNPEATIKAVEAFDSDRKITLILGGRDKNTDISEMVDLIKKKVGEVILLGEAKDRFRSELEKKSYNKIKEVKDLDEAIIKSLQSGAEIVLFSPACASFDMFKNYEERGRTFKTIIKGLK
jgi:UDP-N-acetylmuramoylalanine--D-glutamate ligase